MNRRRRVIGVVMSLVLTHWCHLTRDSGDSTSNKHDVEDGDGNQHDETASHVHFQLTFRSLTLTGFTDHKISEWEVGTVAVMLGVRTGSLTIVAPPRIHGISQANSTPNKPTSHSLLNPRV